VKKRNLTISTQLLIGFLIVLTFVVVLGVVSSVQTTRLYEQEKTLYEHPLQVKEAVDEITSDILESRVGVRDYILFDDAAKKLSALQTVESSFSDIEMQFGILYELYLGPVSDLDSAYDAFVNWKVATQNRLDLARTGNTEDIVASLGDQGDVGSRRIELTSGIKVIDEYASNKADEVNAAFGAYYRYLTAGRIALVGGILILSTLISLYMIQSIRRPLDEMNHEIARFREGELTARSGYSKNNEFGKLSSSFNTMADAIQLSLELREKSAALTGAMLRQEDAKAFFRATMEEMAKHLGANTAAVYLLSRDKRSFVCFDSIGLDEKARESFDAHTLEGEFGMALFTQKIQYIRDIPEDTRFRFLVSGGEFVPREIITIPVVSSGAVVAIFSLSCLGRFYEHSIRLIESVLATMNARIEGILAFQTIKDMLGTLEAQNRELDAQKSELTAQADELMQQNAELDAQSSQLAEASRLKTTFLSNMSHELRTPLNSIIALSGVLTRRLSQKIPEEELSYLEIVERNGRHLLALINDILDISRIEAGREEVEVTKFGLGGILADITAMLEPLATQKEIDLIWQTGGEEIYLTSDERKCRHILQNIVGNAVKFTETGSVRVVTQKNGDFARITVTDTGIGIAKENLASIFDEFQQADGTTSRKYGGTGLGLAIAKKYAEMLGGSISVSSTPGTGSEFVISLPLLFDSGSSSAKQAPALPASRPAVLNRPEGQSAKTGWKTILLVEDSEPAIIQIKDLMEQSGHTILVARSAREAYRLVERTVPDAMILDLMMPEIDGFETLNTLRSSEKTANVPVLILSAKHITGEELGLLKKNHVHQVIQKGGVNRDDLLSAVSDMLRLGEVKAAAEEEPGEAIESAGPHQVLAREDTDDGKPLILVVEDNADNRTTVRALLQDEFCVIEAENGEQGIDMAKNRKPDLILMDIALPGISGIDAFRAIRSAPATCRIPIIALTASAMIQERASILAHGFEAFVAKPIQIDELFRVIGEVLYGR
jgi:signal transduction histidine kinase/DNA-binding response OmpR family regulator